MAKSPPYVAVFGPDRVVIKHADRHAPGTLAFFGAGRDWSPSEVVQFLRDGGSFEGTFTEISWEGGE